MKLTFEKSNRALKLASVPLLLAGLSACASPGFKADVSRFQAQLPAPTGESFAVVADDPKLAGGLEFSQYAKQVEAQMARLGYTPATPENASLLVRFDYGVDNGRETIRSTGGFGHAHFAPFHSFGRRGFGRRGFSRFGHGGFGRRGFGRRGFGRSSFAFGFYDPYFGGPEIRSITVYTSGIDMKIDRTATGERLFEGKAEALSTSNRLPYLVPNLVEAMFTDFPGSGSGETLRITIKPEETKVRRIN